MCDRIRLGMWCFAGHRDYETAGLRDHGTTGPRDTLKNTGVLSRSQSFSGVLSSAWQLDVRVVQHAPKRDEFVVRRASDTTLGEFRVDGLY